MRLTQIRFLVTQTVSHYSTFSFVGIGLVRGGGPKSEIPGRLLCKHVTNVIILGVPEKQKTPFCEAARRGLPFGT